MPKNFFFHLVEGETRDRHSMGSPLLSVTVPQLGSFVENLLSSGLVPASLNDYVTAKIPGPENFTISFDDAHPGVLDLAAPLLAELGTSATVFVPTAYIGESERVMGWPELRELSRRPEWTVGSHSASHSRMSWRLNDEDGEMHARRLFEEEARGSREVLETRLGVPIMLFAYPFGEAPGVARHAVAEAGYRAAFTVGSTQEWNGDIFGIPRLDGNGLICSPTGVKGPNDEEVGISVIVPACDRVPVLREVVRRLTQQSYPTDCFEVVVVDDGSKENLQLALEPFLGGNVRLLALERSDGIFRAGQARQAGARAAKFDVLAFLDADVAVDRDFLWHLGYCHGLDSRAVVLGYLSGYNLHDLGSRHELEDITAAERLTGDVVPVILDRGREPILRQCLDDIHGLAEPWRLAYTGNLSVSRALLDEAGGFSEAFDGWGFEDVDLGARFHDANALWIFSRWALGYHLSDQAEVACDVAPRNPFRDLRPTTERFSPALSNLETLRRLHPGHAGVASFCEQIASDAEEICHPPAWVGVEIGAALPFDWPFARRIHKAWPGGLPLMEILERLGYAEKLGVRSLYLLGGDVALRPELLEILEAASQHADDVTLETTGIPFGNDGVRLAGQCSDAGMTAAVIEILAGRGHPHDSKRAVRGVASLRSAGIDLSAKLVVGQDDRSAFERACRWAAELRVPIDSALVIDAPSATWVSSSLGNGVEVEVWEAETDRSKTTP